MRTHAARPHDLKCHIHRLVLVEKVLSLGRQRLPVGLQRRQYAGCGLGIHASHERRILLEASRAFLDHSQLFQVVPRSRTFSFPQNALQGREVRMTVHAIARQV